MTSSRTIREAAVRWWVGPTCRLDEGVRAWCDGDDSVEVGHDVKRLADALDAAYARGVEDAARVADDADPFRHDSRHVARVIRALAKGCPR